MRPQLQQAIKILQLSLPELEVVVQNELESNPMLDPLDHSVAETAANDTNSENGSGAEEPLSPEPEAGASPETETEWTPPSESEERPVEVPVTDAPDAAVKLRETPLDKLDWREYLENYSNNWQDGEAPDSDDDRRQTLENTLTRKTSLEDHLMWQLRLSSLDETEQRVGATIIYNLNDDGYLETPLEELAGQLEVAGAEGERGPKPGEHAGA